MFKKFTNSQDTRLNSLTYNSDNPTEIKKRTVKNGMKSIEHYPWLIQYSNYFVNLEKSNMFNNAFLVETKSIHELRILVQNIRLRLNCDLKYQICGKCKCCVFITHQKEIGQNNEKWLSEVIAKTIQKFCILDKKIRTEIFCIPYVEYQSS